MNHAQSSAVRDGKGQARGYSLEEFLDAFPSVTREQAIAALEAAHDAVSGSADLPDEQLPRQLAPYFVGYDVRTTQEEGGAGLKNGARLKQARETGFEVFITGDKHLQFQQNLKLSGVFVVVLAAPSNKLEGLIPRISVALQVIARATVGAVERIDV